MICRLRWPYKNSPECGLPMVERAAPGVGVLRACSVHDGDAANAVLLHPRNNRPKQ